MSPYAYAARDMITARLAAEPSLRIGVVTARSGDRTWLFASLRERLRVARYSQEAYSLTIAGSTAMRDENVKIVPMLGPTTGRRFDLVIAPVGTDTSRPTWWNASVLAKLASGGAVELL